MNEEDLPFKLNNNVYFPILRRLYSNNETVNTLNTFKNINSADFEERIFLKLRNIFGARYKNTYEYKVVGQMPSNLSSVLNYLNDKNLISNHYFRKSYNDDFPIFRYGIEINNDGVTTDGNSYSHNLLGGGSDFNRDIAVSKAIGEFLERYCLSNYKESNFEKYTITQLKQKKVNFVDPRIFASSYKNKRKINENSYFLWTKVRDLDNKKYLIPAQLIYWTYRRKHQDFDEPIIRETNTNGGGGFFSKEGAILSGLYELIQRDGFLRFWLAKKAPSKIDEIESVEIQKILEKAKRFKFDVTWYYTGNNLQIPTVACVVNDLTNNGPKISVGGGCSSNIEKTMISAFTEAMSLFCTLRLEGFYKDQTVTSTKFENVGHMERIRLWGNLSMVKNLDFFTNGSRIKYNNLVKMNLELDEKKELKEISQRIESLGDEFKILYFEDNSKILNDLSYKVCKVLVPGFINLYLNEQNKPDFISKKLTPSEIINTIPHPFP